jgi:poly-gamma-glutamate capsule biosynthesis protein CapA/YwtB (metallophosphatase superfamily)
MSTSSTTRSLATTLSDVSPAARAAITLGFGGDTSFTNGLDQRDPFGAIVDLLRAPDLMVVNLETAVADPDVGRPPVAKPFLFKSPPESLQLLVDAGIDAVGLANNHTLDFGADALAQTLAELDAAGIPWVGAGIDQDAAYQPLVLVVGDWRVGLVSLSRVPCDWSASGENVRPQVAWACPPFLPLADEMVRAAQAEADITVVMVHGGEEGVLCPSSFMVELEQHWADLGVDVVIDGHPHVVQGITSLPAAGGGDTLVVHSTGNFAFPSTRGITGNSAIFLVDVSEEGVRLRVEPVRADGGVLRLPSEQQRESILAQINRVSSGWVVDDNGTAQPTPEHLGSCG